MIFMISKTNYYVNERILCKNKFKITPQYHNEDSLFRPKDQNRHAIKAFHFLFFFPLLY
jgi:hypothetical protein